MGSWMRGIVKLLLGVATLASAVTLAAPAVVHVVSGESSEPPAAAAPQVVVESRRTFVTPVCPRR